MIPFNDLYFENFSYLCIVKENSNHLTKQDMQNEMLRSTQRVGQGTLILRSDRIYQWRICFITAKSLPLNESPGQVFDSKE